MLRKSVRIEIAKISTRERSRLRPADPAQVDFIATSIADRGLLHAILVYPASNEAKGAFTHVLAAGLHRLKACEQLGHAEIDATIGTAEEARLIEIEENLCRANLSALDQARHIEEHRRLYEAMQGAIKRGGDQKRKISLWSDAMQEIAVKAGLSKAKVKRADAIGRKLTPELRDALRGTDFVNKEGELYRLAQESPAKQRRAAELILQDKDKAREIIGRLTGKSAKKTSQEKVWRAVTGNWSDLTHINKARFLREIVGLEDATIEAALKQRGRV